MNAQTSPSRNSNAHHHIGRSFTISPVYIRIKSERKKIGHNLLKIMPNKMKPYGMN